MDDRTQPAAARPLTRRKLLRAAGIALPALAAPYIVVAAERRLRVSTFGGYFERMFAEHIHPAFTKATGITVQSIEQSEGAQFLFQLAAANKAGKPPMDVCCSAAIDVLRGRAQSLWVPVFLRKLCVPLRIFVASIVRRRHQQQCVTLQCVCL
jgi:putative spermidine/putrescine transport system substrate-binding protein